MDRIRACYYFASSGTSIKPAQPPEGSRNPAVVSQKNMRTLIVVLCLTAFPLLSTGCTHFSVGQPDCPGSDTCAFMGLADAAKRGERLHVVVVHGIGPHQIGYSDELIDKLMRKVGASPAAGGGVRRLPAAPFDLLPNSSQSAVAGGPHVEASGPQALLAVRRFRTPDGKQIFTYELTWAPIVDPLKQALTYDVAPAREHSRAKVNRNLKRHLIDERLSDPIIYLGYQRPGLQYPVAHTICSVLGGEVEYDPSRSVRCELQKNQDPFAFVPYLQKNDKIAIITQSLGSKITFDVLTQFVKDPLFASAIRGTLTTVFMLANQLPLLELADRDPLSPTTSLGEFAEALRPGATCHESQFSVVAISDPNDLLSFDISDTFALRTPNVTFANVPASLGKRYVGFAVDPLGAHVNHELNDGLLQLIVNGFGRVPAPSAECQ